MESPQDRPLGRGQHMPPLHQPPGAVFSKLRPIQGRTRGLRTPTTHQRRHAGHDLWAHRRRLHDGLRHHRHDQLRPRRRFHDRLLPLLDRPAADRRARHFLRPARPRPDAGFRRRAGRAVWLDDRARRLPAAARLLPPGAADQRDRHVHHAAELHPDRAGRPRQTHGAPGPPADCGCSRSTGSPSNSPGCRSPSSSPRWSCWPSSPPW